VSTLGEVAGEVSQLPEGDASMPVCSKNPICLNPTMVAG
jgi:hypothetical protein